MGRFKTKKDIQLLNGGYLSDENKKPVNNKAFVELQRKAEWLVTLAAKMKGKTFVGAEVSNMNDLINQTNKELNGEKITEFITMPVTPKTSLADQLKEEAVAFVEGHEKITVATAVNAKLQEFQPLADFENHGLFFNGGVVKLNEIYTMKQIIKAATIVYTVTEA